MENCRLMLGVFDLRKHPAPAVRFFDRAFVLAAVVLTVIAPCRGQDADGQPARSARVWIFAGTPGDEAHHAEFEKLLGGLRRTFTTRFAIPKTHLTVLYGPKGAGYDGPCTKENLARELALMVELAKNEEEGPFWVILVGHANTVAGGSKFNLPEKDISASEFGRHLADLRPGAPLVLWATTTSSYPFLRAVSAPGRVVVSANNRKDIENETLFPHAFAAALQSPESDLNGDARLSVAELFLATKSAILKRYENEDLIVKEHAVLDGNGDGYGTMRPSRKDAEGAILHLLPIGGPRAGFD
jgi:hypothetical protein